MQIGLYIHIPFCASKCYYCDFLSFPKRENEGKYIEALIKEIEVTSNQLSADTTIRSIFIGGGTPTVLPPILLDRLMQAIVRHFTLDKDCEWTIEANPGTLDLEKIAVFKKYPITRISLGLQSSHNHLLKDIGRIHRFEDWISSIELIREHTDWQINTDLMFGLPGQTLEELKETLERVTSYSIDHLSVYALIVEEGTHFGNLYNQGKLELVEETLDREMYHFTQHFLKDKGYNQYEISNWSRGDKVCKHNLIYWQCEPYLGMGLGAHSLFGDRRYYNEDNIEEYIKNSGDLDKIRYSEENLTPKALMEEYIFLGLRLIKGINVDAFKNKFGRTIFECYGDTITRWLELNILLYEDGQLYLSDYGLDVSNQVMASFI